MTPKQLLNFVLSKLEEKKAEKITSLNIKKLTDIADYMVICTATSSRHVKGLADHLATEAKHKGNKPLGVEEDPRGEWTLVDLNDVIVHIMQENVRELYNLEELWSIELANENRTNNNQQEHS